MGLKILIQMVSLYDINNSNLLFTDMSLFTSIELQTNFTLVSTSRDADPPVFTLTFVVDRRPPTDVTCTVDSIMFNIPNNNLSREVLESENHISVCVIVTIGMRQGGTYQCTVSNDATNGSTATSEAITVTGICLILNGSFRYNYLHFYSN